MSLNAAERRATGTELRANLVASGLDVAQVAADLGIGAEAIDAALRLSPDADPVEVWLLRDHLEAAAAARGRRPVPYTVLTEASRDAARRWFPLRDAPGCDVGPS